MKFLIQTNTKNQVIHDFSFTLLEALQFYKWKGTSISTRFWNKPYDFWNKPFSDMADKDFRSWIPIGSIEFTQHHLAHFHGVIPTPINVPEPLYPYAGRDIHIGYKDTATFPYFAKSTDKIKDVADIIIDDYEHSILSDYKKYQISSIVDIHSEWRGFVYKRQLLDIRNYSGDFRVFPDIASVDKMIDVWENAPEAYTIDVFVNDKGTFVLECHDFFSVGFYGFEDMINIPKMFDSWFRGVIDV